METEASVRIRRRAPHDFRQTAGRDTIDATARGAAATGGIGVQLMGKMVDDDVLAALGDVTGVRRSHWRFV